MSVGDEGSYSIKRASLINACAKYSQVIVQLLVNVVLARLLTPSAYGVVAVVTVFITLFNILSEMGFAAGIVQDKGLDHEQTRDIFSFTLVFGPCLGLLFIMISWGLSIVYDDVIYREIAPYVAVAVALNAANMVPKAVLLKKRKFALIGLRTVLAAVVSGLVAVILAFLGWGVYALILQTVLNSLVFLLWNVASIRLRPSLRPRIASLRRIWGYSMYQFGYSFVNYLARNLDNLFVGKIFGATQLGLYNKSYQLMVYPTNNLTSVITPSLHPILSEFQNDPMAVYVRYEKVIRFLAFVGAFVGAFCFFAADEIVLLMYGDSWRGAIPVFKALSCSVFAQMVYSAYPSALQSLGDTRRLLNTAVVNTAITLASICPGLVLGDLQLVAVGVSVAYNISLLVAFHAVIVGGFGLRFRRFLSDFRNYLWIHLALLAGAIVWPFDVPGVLWSFVVKLVVSGALFTSLVWAFGEWGVVAGLLPRNWGRKGGR